MPFGRRKLPGVVVALEPEDREPENLRPIAEVLDVSPALDSQLLDFTRWVADYYFAPWGEVIQAALPAALKTRMRRRLLLTSQGREILENPFAAVSSGARRLLDLLARKGPLSDGRVNQILPGLASRTVVDLLARDWIRSTAEELRPEAGMHTEEWVHLVAGRRLAGPSSRAEKQRRLVDVLASSGGSLPGADLLRRAGASRPSLSALARRGAVRLERRPSQRIPAELAPEEPFPAPELGPRQREAAAAVLASLEEGRFRTFLLHGVTGSGKTEVYLAAAAAALERGQGVLYLVPEIGLTPLLARRLSARFPGRVALLHSGLSEGERRDQWMRIRDGRASLVLGTRSAVFAPHPRIGLVVVDEEQDSSYYQVESPRYNARDAALVRAQRLGATAILGSATPSVEGVAAARRGKFHLLSLPQRVQGRPMPEVRLIDMREEFRATGAQTLLSRALVEAIREIRGSGEQGVILLNRRGFATFLLCRACGAIATCSRCSIALTYHRSENRLQCHYCNASRRLPSACPSCRSPHLHLGGAGTERLEEAVRTVDPSLRIGRMDRDTVRGRGHAAVLERFVRGEIDLLVGTQMVAKGHDFPAVTLVGVVSADAYLGLPDFRAAERTYQLLTQVAGRAGRGDRPGRVLVQAFWTEHYALRSAVEGNPDAFYDRELHLRKLMRYPPMVALTQVLLKDRSLERGSQRATRVAERLRSVSGGKYEVLGPSLSPLPRLRGEYRHQILLKGRPRSALAEGLREALDSFDGSREALRNLWIRPASRAAASSPCTAVNAGRADRARLTLAAIPSWR